jgi:hypothetical protein
MKHVGCECEELGVGGGWVSHVNMMPSLSAMLSSEMQNTEEEADTIIHETRITFDRYHSGLRLTVMWKAMWQYSLAASDQGGSKGNECTTDNGRSKLCPHHFN